MVSTPGSHLENPGEYEQIIAKLIKKYPNLISTSHKPWAAPRQFASAPRLVCFQLSPIASAGDNPAIYPLHDIDEVKAFILNTDVAASEPDPVRRIWIMEGTHPSYVAVLGKAFDIDPRLWMRHQRLNTWESAFSDSGNAPVLPSLHSEQRGFTLSYCQLMHLNYDPEDVSTRTRCAENERHIALTRRIRKEEADEKFDGVGIVHRKASFWSQPVEKGGWNG